MEAVVLHVILLTPFLVVLYNRNIVFPLPKVGNPLTGTSNARIGKENVLLRLSKIVHLLVGKLTLGRVPAPPFAIPPHIYLLNEMAVVAAPRNLTHLITSLLFGPVTILPTMIEFVGQSLGLLGLGPGLGPLALGLLLFSNMILIVLLGTVPFDKE